MVVIVRIMLVAVLAVSSSAVRMSQTLMNTYEVFRQEFGVSRDPSEHIVRAAIFERRREEVRQHNSRPGMKWVAVVNKFADYTDEEFTALLGHRQSRRALAADAAPSMQATSFLQSRPEQELAQKVDWRDTLNLSSLVRDQGPCGSCWAVASAGAIETHLEKAARAGSQTELFEVTAMPEVSFEELVDCVPNPELCGGSGGCNGATSELAFGYMVSHGIGRLQDYHGYQSGGDGTCRPPTHPAVTVSSFVHLPDNEAMPLQTAVATQGPVVVSADAERWGIYGGGVFDSCPKDSVINHAILLMGYGTDEGVGADYWLIRNSWGPSWGEEGFIRLLKHKDGESFCGVDNQPLEGVGCRGGPSELPVCGMCGILADSAYPTGVQVAPTV